MRYILDAGFSDPTRHGASPADELRRASLLIRTAPTVLAVDKRAAASTRRATTVADALNAAGRGRSPAAVDLALIVSADHGLNASTFATRVIAGTGADLYACLLGGLAALSGPRHGRATDRVEALLDEADNDPERAVGARLSQNEPIPGFGHPLYEDGDPRALLLLQRAHDLGGERAELCQRVVAAAGRRGAPPPNIDVGLVALRAAAGLPRGFASALFAVGRMAGWVAHILESRAEGSLLRPRARYRE